MLTVEQESYYAKTVWIFLSWSPSNYLWSGSKTVSGAYRLEEDRLDDERVELDGSSDPSASHRGLLAYMPAVETSSSAWPAEAE